MTPNNLKNLENTILSIIIKTILIFGAIWMLFLAREIIMILFLVIIVSSTLRPAIEFLEQYKIPRVVSAMSVLLLLIGGVFFLAQSLAGEIIAESEDLSSTLGQNYATVIEQLGLTKYLAEDSETGVRIGDEFNQFLTSNIENFSNTLLDFGTTLFSAFLTLVTSIALIFYLLYDPEKPKRFIIGLLPKKNQKIAFEITKKTERKLSYWLAGQVVLMITMGIVSYLGFKLIGVDFALPLATIVGLLDIIPVVGPIIAFIPVFLVVLVTDPFKIFLVSVFYLFIQQIEGNILVPKVMATSVGLDSVAVIVALMIGASIFGILGAILSIPVAVIVMILHEEWQKRRID